MPIITIEAGKMNREQKSALIQGFTNVASETLHIAPEKFVVVLKENDPDNIGTGGRMLSQVQAERRK